MPELPEVETTMRGLAPFLNHTHFLDCEFYVSSLRQPLSSDLRQYLKGAKSKELHRRGKYILLPCKTSDENIRPNRPFTLLFHLGMSGSLQISEKGNYLPRSETRPMPGPHDRYRLTLQNKTGTQYYLYFHDPRRFGMFLAIPGENEMADQHPLLARLGIEPLTKEFSGQYLATKLQKKKVAIKTALMDSHIVTGIGNIYASEALFSARIDPRRPASSLTPSEYQRLVSSIRKKLQQAISAGGTTLRDFVASDAKPGYFALSLDVYKRSGQPCHICQWPVKTIRLNGRSTFFCSHCQK